MIIIHNFDFSGGSVCATPARLHGVGEEEEGLHRIPGKIRLRGSASQCGFKPP